MRVGQWNMVSLVPHYALTRPLPWQVLEEETAKTLLVGLIL